MDEDDPTAGPVPVLSVPSTPSACCLCVLDSHGNEVSSPDTKSVKKRRSSHGSGAWCLRARGRTEPRWDAGPPYNVPLRFLQALPWGRRRLRAWRRRTTTSVNVVGGGGSSWLGSGDQRSHWFRRLRSRELRLGPCETTCEATYVVACSSFRDWACLFPTTVRRQYTIA